MNTTKTTLSLLLATCSALGLSACGGGSDTKTAASSSVTTGTKNVTPGVSPSSTAATSASPTTLPAGPMDVLNMPQAFATQACARVIGKPSNALSLLDLPFPNKGIDAWTDAQAKNVTTDGTSTVVPYQGFDCLVGYKQANGTPSYVAIHVADKSALNRITGENVPASKVVGKYAVSVNGLDLSATNNVPNFTAAQKTAAQNLVNSVASKLS